MSLNSKTPGSSLLYIWNNLSGRQWSWSSTLTIWTGMMAWLSAGHGNLSFSSLERVDGPFTSSDLQPFQGPLPLSCFPMLIWRFLSPHSIVWSDFLPDILPPWARKPFFPLFPFHYHFFISLQFLLSFCFSPSLSFIIIFQFFSNFFFPALPVLLGHFLSCPPLP